VRVRASILVRCLRIVLFPRSVHVGAGSKRGGTHWVSSC
jgi:hypothetical protein